MSRVFGQLFLQNVARDARREVNAAIRQVSGPQIGSQVRRYARASTTGGGLLEGLISTFLGGNRAVLGELRRALGGVWSEREIARELLREIEPQAQPQTTGGGRGGRGGRNRIGGTAPAPDEPPQGPPPPLQPGHRRQRRTTDGAPPRPGEQSPYGQEIATPASTNVFSFSFVPDSSKTRGTLYVTFKAAHLNADGVSRGKGRRGGRDQLRGTLGSTVTGKRGGRGPMYAYYGVSTADFHKLYNVRDQGGQSGGCKSPGTFVWDRLRTRGSLFGQRYPYQLVQAQIVTQAGVSGEYVPRKATSDGYKVRSVASLGEGRRSFVSSTLPAQSFRSRVLVR